MDIEKNLSIKYNGTIHKKNILKLNLTPQFSYENENLYTKKKPIKSNDMWL